jgi:glyoxylase-like metal-dependent hydrolase (beta-lactamase superfamily II)
MSLKRKTALVSFLLVALFPAVNCYPGKAVLYDGETAVIPLRIVNSFIIKGKDRLIVVDTGEEGNEKIILREIEKLGYRADQLSLIVITHGHIDHYGSAAALESATGAKIAVHKYDAPFLINGIYAPVESKSLMGDMIKRCFIQEDKKIPGVIPDILMSEIFDLEPYGVKGRVIATPGHTRGSVSVILDSGTCIAGDLMMDYIRPDYSAFAMDSASMQESIRKLIALNPQKVYFSHGKSYDAGIMKAIVMREM